MQFYLYYSILYSFFSYLRTYKPSQIRRRVIGNSGTRSPTDKELKRILYWAKEGGNPERNELIVMMQLNGFRITETATITVDCVM